VGESALPGGWRQILECEPPPDVVFHTLERCRVLLNQLSPELRSVALRKMEGFTNAEIAEILGCVEGTVERKLRVIRSIWKKDIVP
jgi:DNA-directed RNA polymerase specialized sigma24 family protein